MATKLTYRQTLTPTIPGATSLKGAPLTNEEIDANFKTLDNEKVNGDDARLSDDRDPNQHDNTRHSTNYTPETRTLTAGTGMTGGGTLEANRQFDVTYGTTAGTAAEGDDARLSDAREWTATTVTQSEAEAGTATVRRAWTAERIKQAIETIGGATIGAPSITTGTPHSITGVGFTIPVEVLAFGATDKDSLRLAVDYRVDGTSIWSRTGVVSATELIAYDVAVSGLDPDTLYEYRGVALDDLNPDVEVFSEIGTVQTENTYVEQPSITSPTANETEIGETPTFTSSAFSVFGTTDTHAASQWVVRLASNSSIVHDSGEDVSNLTSYELAPEILVENTSYTVEVRHKGTTLGFSDYSTAVTFTTAESFGPTVLGEAWGGGYYIGTITASGSNYYLIVAPNATGCAECQWKTTQTTTAGTLDDYDGYANTYPALNNTTHPAGYFCATRTIGGYEDWYLPAIEELQVMYTNDGGATSAVTPTGEGFDANNYWSSTEASATNACRLYFSNGNRYSFSKTYTYRSRAVRREPI